MLDMLCLFNTKTWYFLVFKGVIFYEKSLLGACVKCSVFVGVKNKNKLTGLFMRTKGRAIFKN